jgi:NAD+ kinase
MTPPRRATVLTHRRPHDTAAALRALAEAARTAGFELHADAEEAEKHGLDASSGIVIDGPGADPPDLCFALGGDGTILAALRRYAGLDVPVFAVNFGEVGFLATIDKDEMDEGFPRAFAGDFEVLELPAITLNGEGAKRAFNDVSLHRLPGGRVADLSYMLGGVEIGRVRCDGFVVATPAGSTGYNLANGGPVLAWGVEGFVVSFIAPHTLTARALVAAPRDVLVVRNDSREEAVEVSIDGRPEHELGPGEQVEVGFASGEGHLAQLPGTTFYHRLREKFGRLAS